MSVASDLRATAHYLRVHGLKGGELGGPRCMVGAVQSVLHTNFYDSHALVSLRAMLNVLEKVTGCDVAEFSDLHCRSTDDAVAAFEIAADVAS